MRKYSIRGAPKNSPESTATNRTRCHGVDFMDTCKSQHEVHHSGQGHRFDLSHLAEINLSGFSNVSHQCNDISSSPRIRFTLLTNINVGSTEILSTFYRTFNALIFCSAQSLVADLRWKLCVYHLQLLKRLL